MNTRKTRSQIRNLEESKEQTKMKSEETMRESPSIAKHDSSKSMKDALIIKEEGSFVKREESSSIININSMLQEFEELPNKNVGMMDTYAFKIMAHAKVQSENKDLYSYFLSDFLAQESLMKSKPMNLIKDYVKTIFAYGMNSLDNVEERHKAHLLQKFYSEYSQKIFNTATLKWAWSIRMEDTENLKLSKELFKDLSKRFLEDETSVQEMIERLRLKKDHKKIYLESRPILLEGLNDLDYLNNLNLP